MLNENIKEYYKGKLFEEVINEAPIRYNMPEPDIFGLFRRAIKFIDVSDWPVWLQLYIAQSTLAGRTTHIPGQVVRSWDLGKVIRVSDRNGGLYALKDDTGRWYWVWPDINGNAPWNPMRAPKGWNPDDPYNIPADIWQHLPSSARDDLMRRFLTIPGLGGLGILGQELIDPDTEGEFDPDTVVPDFDPNNVYAGMGNNPNHKGQGV